MINLQDTLRKHELWLQNLQNDDSGERADLRMANLGWANLHLVNLNEADLRWAILSGADLSGADLSGADLRWASLSWASLREASLSKADLREANLRGANLSGATGLLTAREFMAQFDRDEHGWIVFKAFGVHHDAPNYWTIEPGAFIEEDVNQEPCLECGCGVNFATLAWFKQEEVTKPIWRCRIRYEDGPDITVPYNTDGKARCGRLELLEVLT